MSPLLAALLLSTQPVPATLSEASFVAGRWLSEEDGMRSEEVWTAPAGDGMVGTWRLVVKGEAKVIELLSIRAEGGSLVMRLRHFDAALVGREERERPLVLPLAAKGDGLLRFSGPRVDGGAGPVTLTYRRTADGGLEVTLEKDAKAQAFVFRRA